MGKELIELGMTKDQERKLVKWLQHKLQDANDDIVSAEHNGFTNNNAEARKGIIVQVLRRIRKIS